MIDYDTIVQPIINIKEIDSTKWGQPFQLSKDQEWCMNTLKTAERSQGTRSGKIDDATWLGNIKEYFDNHIETEFNQI